MKKESIYRGTIYFVGLLLLAFGITLNTKTDLGVSPIISVAYSVSYIWKLNFGNVTFILYMAFVLMQMAVHFAKKQKKQMISDILQIPLSLVFTRFLNLFTLILPDFSKDFAQNWMGSFAGRLLFLMVAIISTGIGMSMSVNMRLIPNPGDGIVQTIADCFGIRMGLAKNCFDGFCILCTAILSFICADKLVGIGVGTILAMIGVGRSVAVFNLFFLLKMMRIAGFDDQIQKNTN